MCSFICGTPPSAIRAWRRHRPAVEAPPIYTHADILRKLRSFRTLGVLIYATTPFAMSGAAYCRYAAITAVQALPVLTLPGIHDADKTAPPTGAPPPPPLPRLLHKRQLKQPGDLCRCTPYPHRRRHHRWYRRYHRLGRDRRNCNPPAAVATATTADAAGQGAVGCQRFGLSLSPPGTAVISTSTSTAGVAGGMASRPQRLLLIRGSPRRPARQGCEHDGWHA